MRFPIRYNKTGRWQYRYVRRFAWLPRFSRLAEAVVWLESYVVLEMRMPEGWLWVESGRVRPPEDALVYGTELVDDGGL